MPKKQTNGLECPKCHNTNGYKITESGLSYHAWFNCPDCGFKCFMRHYTDNLKESKAKERLEYLRQELRAERMSYSELAELQSLAKYIDPCDVELLEPADVPEFSE